MEPSEILTVGHSSLPYERFLQLLRLASVTAIVDVRTAPYSRQNPQFNRETLKQQLRADGITYVFLGAELGGRPSEPQLYCDGIADYERMSRTKAFKKGLDRVLEGAKKFRVALVCSERSPLDCHRCLLVGRALAERGAQVSHILDDGSIVTHADLETKLLQLWDPNGADLFASRSEQLTAAYRARSRQVAFKEPEPDPGGSIAAE